MAAILNLDEMILQYTESPFLDEKLSAVPAIINEQQKRKVLGRLLLIASNLFIKTPGSELGCYKRRYELP